jgi:DNA helicase-2/ATP-dependent DNA helicase PcrA
MTALMEAVAELRENAEQWEAFRTAEDCVVLAPPGSGKTKLLTVRLVWDLRERIPEPHGAACITYTNAAAGELIRRTTELGAPRRSNLFIGTVHAFALRAIIGPYARLADRGYVADAQIAGDHEIDACYRQAEDEFFAPGESRVGVRHTVALRRKHLNYDPEDVGLGGERLLQVARRWESLLADRGLIDFDDLVRHAVEIVEGHGWLRRVLAARFPRLYLDEYQDLAPGLDRLVRALCFDQTADAEMFAVGDPDQSIMGFNGSKPELLLALADTAGVHTTRLRTNYRSGAAIGQAALSALREERSIEWLDEGGEVRLYECPERPSEQFERLVNLVEAERAAGTPLEEIAVLCPNKWWKADVTSALNEAEIPAFVRGDEYRETPTTSLVESAAAWASQPRGESGFRLGDLLRSWRMLLRARADLAVDSALVSRLLEAEGDTRAGAVAAEMSALGLRRAIVQARRDDEVRELDKMIQALTTGILRDLTLSELGKRAHAPGQVQVSTIHASKGLEFEAVFVVGLDEGVFPSYYVKTPADVAEARRAFYVSITRAKRRVNLLYTGFRVTQWGNVHRDGRCRFLNDL